jgi:Ca2+-binding RTX toxin-like protein
MPLTDVGSEFRVNATIAGNQNTSSVTTLSDGRFVVAWADYSGGNAAFRAQIFTAGGARSGSELRLDDVEGTDRVVIEATADGGFAASWSVLTGAGGDPDDYDVRLRTFAADGTPQGESIPLNTITAGTQGVNGMARLADGRLVVTWEDTNGATYDIRARLVSAGGTPLGPEFRVNTTTAETQAQPVVAALTGGGFAIAWVDVSQSGGDTSLQAIRAQLYAANGTRLGGEILVNTTTANGQYEPAITALTDGRFLVTWTDLSAGLGSEALTDIRGQIFNADGSRSGGEMLLNGPPPTYDYQYDSTVCALSGGRFAVVWTDRHEVFALGSVDGSGQAVVAQLYSAEGVRSGGPIIVNSIRASSQSQPVVEHLGGDRLVVTWTDSSRSPDDPHFGAIRAQIMDAGPPPPRTITGTTGNDSLGGSDGPDLIRGLAGNDTLGGSAGQDTLEGGLGNDRYIVNSTGDIVQGEAGYAQGGGIDTVFAAVDYTAAANIEILRAATGVAGVDLTGNGGINTLVGNTLANRLEGRGGNDQVNGNAGNDTLVGGEGADTLVGGAGADHFVFTSISNSRAGAANRDTINGFDRGAVQDRIDLSAIDANTLTAGVNDAFTFIGSAAYSATGSAGQLRLVGLGGANAVIVEADINGDRVGDFQIFVNLATVMLATDFVL